MHTHKRFAQAGGRLILCATPPVVTEVLDLLRLTDLLDTAPTEAEARDLALGRPEPGAAGGVGGAARPLGILPKLSVLPLEVGRRCISYVKTMADMNISERRRPMDGRWLYNRPDGGRLDLRVNTIPTLYGEDCTVRILD